MEFTMDIDDFTDVTKAVKSVGQDEMYVEFGPDRWVVKSQGPAEVLMTACKVTEDIMHNYKKEETESLGLDIEVIANFISGSSGKMTMRYDDSVKKLYVSDGNLQMEMGTLIEESINGVARSFPKIEYPVRVYNNLNFLNDFIKKTNSSISSGSFIIEARKNNLYIYSQKDEKSVVYDIQWEQLDDCQIDWSSDNIRDNTAGSSFSLDFMEELYKPSQEAALSFGADMPAKLYFEQEDGVDITHVIAPRISKSDNSVDTVPETALNDGDKV